MNASRFLSHSTPFSFHSSFLVKPTPTRLPVDALVVFIPLVFQGGLQRIDEAPEDKDQGVKAKNDDGTDDFGQSEVL